MLDSVIVAHAVLGSSKIVHRTTRRITFVMCQEIQLLGTRETADVGENAVRKFFVERDEGSNLGWRRVPHTDPWQRPRGVVACIVE